MIELGIKLWLFFNVYLPIATISLIVIFFLVMFIAQMISDIIRNKSK